MTKKKKMGLRNLIAILAFGAAITLWQYSKFVNRHGLYYVSPEHGDEIIFGVSGAIGLAVVAAYILGKFRRGM
jgi:hypothetical protein